ncbi:2-hydroxychromene-2-carboxylate isomerase [Roseiarcaceae bacterium H3SJ34-1]|uniref:2-hydroxychromene-2-carboxylate isomerase n=1 Tax=Terripilifer ovatus TaxID=3032367 RepID=UPI003AB9B575|nr:2-hydroxychromene-2-carboxylate isomerase [Roseiarcaceae bacterium H3SJ34-1]
MTAPIDFHFDFISPFSYFALQRLPDIARRFGRDIIYHPVDLAALKLRAGNTAPPTRMMPMKLRHLKIDQQRWARHYGVPIATPAHYDSNLINRGAFLALDRGCIEPYALYAYARIWGEGWSMLDERLFAGAADICGCDLNHFIDFAKSDASAARYAQSTGAAHERGVFGVPTMAVGDEMWWGNDRLDFMTEWLTQNSDKNRNPG